MAFFIWFDNDNLDYGGIGVVEYRSPVDRIMVRRPHAEEDEAENDNPPPAAPPAVHGGRFRPMKRTLAAEGER